MRQNAAYTRKCPTTVVHQSIIGVRRPSVTTSSSGSYGNEFDVKAISATGERRGEEYGKGSMVDRVSTSGDIFGPNPPGFKMLKAKHRYRRGWGRRMLAQRWYGMLPAARGTAVMSSRCQQHRQRKQ